MGDRMATEEIKNRLNVVDVIKGYVPDLKKRGQNYFGLCPFHSEKTPSFSVNEQMQIFKCFGCGASGDVFTFVEKIEHLPFPEVLEKLAQQAGVELEKIAIDPALKKKRETAFTVNRLMQKIYNHFLVKSKLGNPARDYLKKRGINGELIEKFQLGWAPNDNPVYRILKKRGFTDSELLESGAIKSKRVGVGDTFWERVMFPIFNEKGEPVGFIGRVIDKEKMPKYLNTPETAIYRKGKTLYGLNWAKASIGKDGFAIVTEGTPNVISSVKVGRENIVAVLGTGFTPNHANLLKRYTQKVYLAFDMDDAGKNATLRAIPLLLAAELEVGVLELPVGKDIDECVVADTKAWLAAAVSPKEAIDWVFEWWRAKIDVATINGKSRFTNAVKPCILAIKDPVEKEAWIRRVAEVVGVKPETVEASLRQGEVEVTGDEVNQKAVLQKDQLERFMLGLLSQHWKKLKKHLNKVKPSFFSGSEVGETLRALSGEIKAKDFTEVVGKLLESQAGICKEVALMDLTIDEAQVEAVWNELVERLKKKRLEEAMAVLQRKVTDAETKGDSKLAQSYLKKVQRLLGEK